MLRTLLLLAFLVYAPLAAAQANTPYALEVRSGVGDLVVPPYTRFRVTIARNDARPFNGRVVVELSASSGGGGRRRGGPRVESGMVSVIQDITLPEGTMAGLVTLDVPVSGYFMAEVRLERQVTGEYYELVAATEHTPPVIFDDNVKLVAFVSDTRLAAAQDFVFFPLVEIPVAELPDSWKSLAGFDAIILNDDRLTRAQSMALVDYMTAGGTVILSPSGPGSFNPETPAGSLLRIPATTRQQFKKLSEIGPGLTSKLTQTGFGGASGNPVVVPGETGNGVVAVPPAKELLVPPPDSELRIWPDSGRARPVPGSMGLVSIARVGAGNLVLLHTDISATPLTTGDDHMPTTTCVHLINLAMGPVSARAGNPTRLLADKDVRDSVDIAGKRIPGRDVLVVILLLYIAMAGVGMFIVARRIRKPELYPATLFAAALISVVMVFGLGEIYKRSGDRVKAVRVLVSDETTDRNALFTLGCVYAVQGETAEFVNSRKSALVPAKMEPGFSGGRGMPSDTLNYNTSFTAGESNTTVTDLDRWQNVFFLQREPVNLEKFTVEVTSMSGAMRVENRSPHELKACVFLVGLSTPGATTCAWHYSSKIGAAGSADASITFSESTRLAMNVEALADRVAEDADDTEREVLGAMFNLNREDRRGLALNFKQIEDRLGRAGLLPGPDEFLLLAVLPPDALSGAAIGAQDVEDDDVSQINIWIVRGGVEGR